MFDARKTGMIGLPYGGKTMTFSYNTSVSRTDGQTDGRTELLYQYRASAFARQQQYADAR